MNLIRQTFDQTLKWIRNADHQPLFYLCSVWTLMLLLSWGILLLTE